MAISKEALTNWIASGDSFDYINSNELYMISKDKPGKSTDLLDNIGEALFTVKESGNNIKSVLEDLDKDILIPENATLRISYKQQREVEKLEFKIFWDLHGDTKLETNRKASPSY